MFQVCLSESLFKHDVDQVLTGCVVSVPEVVVQVNNRLRGALDRNRVRNFLECDRELDILVDFRGDIDRSARALVESERGVDGSFLGLEDAVD